MATSATQSLDLVLLGATGFTGSLVAEYLAAHAPPDLRWAIAGRNAQRLDELAQRLGVAVPVLHADVSDPPSLRALAEGARAVATTVGPFVEHGDPVVGACAAAGTDYLDMTGEPEFVDRTWLHHGDTAQRTGARLVHACGFESVPHDLGALHAVQQLPDDVPIVLKGYVRGNGAASGGTFGTAVRAFSRARQASRVHRQRRAAEPRPGGRQARAVPGRPGYDSTVRAWVLPLPTLDPQVVVRSARVLADYGPDFRYSHYAAVDSPVTAAALAGGAAATFALAQLPPTRNLLLRARPSGSGPSEQRRARSWFSVTFVGSGGGRRVVTEVRGGDPGYGAAAVMLAESALCLLRDDLPQTAGQVTPAVAMGTALRARLERAGITFGVVEAGEDREAA